MIRQIIWFSAMVFICGQSFSAPPPQPSLDWPLSGSPRQQAMTILNQAFKFDLYVGEYPNLPCLLSLARTTDEANIVGYVIREVGPDEDGARSLIFKFALDSDLAVVVDGETSDVIIRKKITQPYNLIVEDLKVSGLKVIDDKLMFPTRTDVIMVRQVFKLDGTEDFSKRRVVNFGNMIESFEIEKWRR